MKITLSCSPDADDLFMMRALLEGTIDTGQYHFEVSTLPTHALNTTASSEMGPDVIAISTAHYPSVADKYQMLPHGGSMGEGYGPVLVTVAPASLQSLIGKRIGIPGDTTSAWAVLQMIIDSEPVIVPITPYEKIFEALRQGEIDAGLIIHEGRLTYADEGMYKVLDIGEWWYETTGGLPLPLGANAIKRSLGADTISEVSELLRQSIQKALDDRDAAIDWLISKGTVLKTRDRVSQYLDMYANARTLNYGPEGKEGIQQLFSRANTNVSVDFAP